MTKHVENKKQSHMPIKLTKKNSASVKYMNAIFDENKSKLSGKNDI